jgi:hypothetical protein
MRGEIDMTFLMLFISTILFFAFAVIFYYYGAVLAYHEKAEAFKKAAFFSAITFIIYIIPVLLFRKVELVLFLAILLWAVIWFCLIYKQATSAWQRAIR